MLRARQAADELAHGAHAVVVAAAVAVAVDGQEHLRLDLREAVDHAARAELRRGARPDRPEARAREERDQRLGDVGHVGDNPVAPPHAQLAQPRGHRRDSGGQLTPAERIELTELGEVEHGGLVRAGAGTQEVLGVVERGALEPARAGHALAREHA